MPELYPEDQKKVDAFLRQGVNSVERKPLRFKTLLILLISCLGAISVAGYLISFYFDQLY